MTKEIEPRPVKSFSFTTRPKDATETVIGSYTLGGESFGVRQTSDTQIAFLLMDAGGNDAETVKAVVNYLFTATAQGDQERLKSALLTKGSPPKFDELDAAFQTVLGLFVKFEEGS